MRIGIVAILCLLPLLVYARPARVAPGLAVQVELPETPVYAGDPLLVNVRLTSPKADQHLQRAWRRMEKDRPADAVALPQLAVDWAAGLTLTLSKVVSEEKSIPVLVNAQWDAYQLVEQSAIPGTGVWTAAWLVPADVATLKPGQYVLEVSWQGKDRVDAAWLDGEEQLAGKAVTFTVQPAKSEVEIAVHLGRLAQAAYRTGNYAEAVRHADAVLTRLPDEPSPRRARFTLLAANAAFGTGDYQASLDRYQALAAQLPPPQQSCLAVTIQEQIALLEQLIEKRTETEEMHEEEEVTPEEEEDTPEEMMSDEEAPEDDEEAAEDAGEDEAPVDEE
jgi:tetratricopeptide (TPR) repeat protein